MKKKGANYYVNKVLPLISKLKHTAKKHIRKGNYNSAMDNVSLASSILYETNQYLFDDELERYIADISEKFLFSPSEIPKKKKILFYDGFGFDNRGLTKIYLQCLTEHYEIVYCTLKKQKKKIPNLLNILGNNKVYYIENNEHVKTVKEISEIIKSENPSDMFIYILPFDVAAATAFTAYRGQGKRYFINLTDHAFWIGNNSYDSLIEIRDYGAYLSTNERNVGKEKLVKIPMCPSIKTDTEFLGFSFPFDERKQKLFFSGGSLYKTIGEDGRYYELVRNILQSIPDTVFWYAGKGDDKGLKNLKKIFPNRVYHTEERKDLYALLKKCAFYLSTYPICGSLMTQYAAAAGVVPLTLKSGNDGSGLLIEQEKLNFEFEDEFLLIKEANKLVLDEKYRESRKAVFTASVVKKEDFENALISLIDKGEKVFGIQDNFTKDNSFKELYQERINFNMLADCVARKGRKDIFNYPVYYFCGLIIKVFKKIFKR